MLIELFAAQSPLFFLVFIRVFAFLSTVPLLSSTTISKLVRVVFAFMVAIVLFPSVNNYTIPDTGLLYVLLLLGEALLGIIAGFFVTMLFSIFRLAGHYLSLPMGFSVSQVFDPIAQIEIPVVGQFLDLFAMLVFLTNKGLQQIFFAGVMGSFDAIRAVDIATRYKDIIRFLLKGISNLFLYSVVMAFPFLAILFLVSVSLGLLAKTVPQMNLLILGFPISISVSFIILFFFMPALVGVFSAFISWTISSLAGFFQQVEVPISK